MGKFIDLTGQTFGKLTIIKRVGAPESRKNKKMAYWLCKCSCGSKKEIIASTSELKSNNTKSCGCLKIEAANKNGYNNKKQNRYDLLGNFGVGYTHNGKEFYFDIEDFDLIKDYCWFMHDGYVSTNVYKNGKKYCLKMHRLIMDANTNIIIDHKTHATNDNRKEYLRESDCNTNHFNHNVYKNNTSNVTGISFDKDTGKWRARLWEHGNTHDLGRFANFEDACDARKEAEEKYFGEFSYNNSMGEC